MSFSFCNRNKPNYLSFWLYCISFLHDIGFCCIKFPENPLNMQERNTIQPKLQIFWPISIAKRKTHLTEDSSKEYCCHIYQIKALAKTFLLNIVSHSGIFCCNLQLQGTSALYNSVSTTTFLLPLYHNLSCTTSKFKTTQIYNSFCPPPFLQP